MDSVAKKSIHVSVMYKISETNPCDLLVEQKVLFTTKIPKGYIQFFGLLTATPD